MFHVWLYAIIKQHLLCITAGPNHEKDLEGLVEQLKSMGFEEVCITRQLKERY